MCEPMIQHLKVGRKSEILRFLKKAHSSSQVARGVTSRQKTLTKRDPHGMIDTYGGYLKIMVTKSGRQGMAFKGHFCGLHDYFKA